MPRWLVARRSETWGQPRSRRSWPGTTVWALPGRGCWRGVGERLFDLPRLQHALAAGELSLDQVRVLVEVARPETDDEWVEAAQGLSVRDLVALAERRRTAPTKARRGERGGPDQSSVRFNDGACTMTAQLRRAEYAVVRGAIEARVAAMGADGTTPLDVRSADALVSMLAGSGSDSGSDSGSRLWL